MTLKRIAMIWGAIFVLIGILGFIPGVTTFMPDEEHGMLFGLFAVDTLHNFIHIATGIAAIACGMASEAASRTYFKVFGIIYGIVALLGFVYGRMPLMGMMANNVADALLHTVIAVAALALGFGHLVERLEHRRDHTHHPA